MKGDYQQSIKALQLAGMSKSTQLCYTRSVRQLVDFYNTAPKKITEQQVQAYFHLTRKWLENRLDAQLPVHHFMITFTVPERLRGFIRSNQRMAYAAMFAASSQTLKKLAQDTKFIGADLLPAFSAFCIPGAEHCPTIRIFITSCPAARCSNPINAGILYEPTFTCR